MRNASGQIVCRVSTTAGGAAAFPGCQPLNLFGRGGNAIARRGYDYVVGNEPGQQVNTTLFYPSTDLGFTGETLQLHHVRREA